MTGDLTVSHLLRHACHDLRTSLRSVRAYADLLLEARESQEVVDERQLLGQIVDGAQKMDALIGALASYSIALEIDSASFQPAPLNVLFRTALAKLAGRITAQGAAVTAGNLPRVSGNQDRLTELFTNLVANGMRAGPHSPRIDISVEKNGEAFLFRVRDNGPGFESVDLDRIFEPFARVVNDPIGAGLGMAVCREIVNRHGGRIWAESPGAGLTILFTLPAD